MREDLKRASLGVLVTGSTRGLGLAIAECFVSCGYPVVIHGRQAAQSSFVAAQVAKKYQNSCVGSVAGDLAVGRTGGETVIGVYKEAEALLARIAPETSGKIHILVNNAGITRDKLLLRMKVEDWNSVIETNLTAIFHMSKIALRSMLKARNGRIINITSVVGQMGNPGQVNYAASKGGLIAFTKALAREVAAKGITVNAVAPGFIQTDMTDALAEKAREELVGKIPLGRLGEPKDVATAVVFLASEDAGYITGQELAVNGGLFM